MSSYQLGFSGYNIATYMITPSQMVCFAVSSADKILVCVLLLF